jgi:hypothetical protein
LISVGIKESMAGFVSEDGSMDQVRKGFGKTDRTQKERRRLNL